MDTSAEEYIFHVNLGSLYFSGDSEEAIWLYIFAGDIGWTWVGKENYPFMYHQEKGWIMHLEESDWFLDWDTEEWFQVTP